MTNIDGSLGTAEGFFQSYLALPVVILFYAVGYIWKREGWRKVSEIDLDTGRREHDWDTINAYRERLANGPAWKRLWHHLF
jgi:amino acid transporter